MYLEDKQERPVSQLSRAGPDTNGNGDAKVMNFLETSQSTQAESSRLARTNIMEKMNPLGTGGEHSVDAGQQKTTCTSK